MAASAEAVVRKAADAAPLPLNFRKAQRIYGEVESSELGGADPALQAKVAEALALCEVALRQVVHLCVFSPNEATDDINTTDLKYLLLPFYRGELLLRLSDQSKRTEALGEALSCLRGFLADLERLEALAPEVRDGWEAASGGDGAAAAADAAKVREHKIARLKAGRAARQRMEELARRASADPDGEGEEADELEREQVLLLVQCCCHTALDSIRAAEQELDMLQQIAKLRRPDGSLPPPEAGGAETEAEQLTRGLQMMTLMPQALPQTAARAGNPNLDPSSRLSYATAMQQIHTGIIPGLYTYTVEEGLRQEEAERAMAEAARMQQMAERGDARRQKVVDDEEGGEESAEERARLMAQDEFRDNHTRGAGNRRNRN